MTLPRKPPFGLPEQDFSADRRKEVKVMKKPHSHSQIEVNFFQSGAASYLFDGREIAVGKGDFVLFWGAVPHQVVAVEPDTRFSCVYIPLTMLLTSQLGVDFKHALLGGGFLAIDTLPGLDGPLMDQIHMDSAPGDDHLRQLSYQALILRLQRAGLGGWRDRLGRLEAMPKSDRRPHDKVVQMAHFVASQWNQDISVGDIASAAGLSAKHAMTLFRQTLGMTLLQYLNRMRVVASQRMLLEGDVDVASIAFDAGFGSVSQFHEVFRHQTGYTPRKFRQAYRRQLKTGLAAQ